MIVTALDPGGTTGWASANVVPPNYVGPLTQQEFGPGAHHAVLDHNLHDTSPHVIVCESFEFRQFHSAKRTKAKVNLEPVEYIGVVRLYAAHHPDTSLVFQSASQAKGFSRDDKLAALGWYVQGQPHARDATRHLLYYLVVTMGIREPLTTRWRNLLDDHSPTA